MVNPETIYKKLEHLNRYIDFLKKSQKNSLEEFVSNMQVHGSVERYLQLSVEVTIDVANHIIAQKKLGEVNWSQDVATIFYKYSYISKELSDTWVKMIKFRNLLVHEYVLIDKEQVYTILQNHLTDIEELQKMFANNFL